MRQTIQRIIGSLLLIAGVAYADDVVEVRSASVAAAQITVKGNKLLLTARRLFILKPGEGICVEKGQIQLFSRANKSKLETKQPGECYIAQAPSFTQTVLEYIASLRRNPRAFNGVGAQSRAAECASSDLSSLHFPNKYPLELFYFPSLGAEYTLQLWDKDQLLQTLAGTDSQEAFAISTQLLRKAKRLDILDSNQQPRYRLFIYQVDTGFSIPDDPEQAAALFLSLQLIDYAPIAYSYAQLAHLEQESELLSSLILSYAGCVPKSR